MFCRRCGSVLDESALVCDRCGTRVGVLPQPASVHRAGSGGDSTGGLIPYKNAPALISYYLGLFSPIFPPLGIASLVLGIIGLKKRKENPQIKGTAHAWVGIGCGGLTIVATIVLLVFMILAASAKPGG